MFLGLLLLGYTRIGRYLLLKGLLKGLLPGKSTQKGGQKGA